MDQSRESPKVDIFIEEAAEFVQCSPEEELGKLVNLVRSSFEPVLVYDGDEYLGSVSLQNAIFNSRLEYKSRADSHLATSGPVTPTTTVNAAIRQMISYGWLRVPVFNDELQLIGQFRARNILRTLIKNETFLQIMVLKSEIRQPMVVEYLAKVEDAYKMLKSKQHSRVFVVDEEGKLAGTVSKDSLMKAFNKAVESKRFSTKNGSPFHNIYVGEKTDRDDYWVRDFIDRRMYGLTARPTDDKTEIITKLVNSSFNSIAVVDDDGLPVGILSLRDLLRSLLVRDPSGDINLIYRGFEEVKETELQKVNSIVAELGEFIEKIEAIDQIELSNNEVKSSEGKINTYELMIKVDLASGETYLVHEDARELIKGVGQLADEVKKQVRRYQD